MTILKQKSDKRKETENKRIREEGRERKRAQWNTPEKTEPARQGGLAEEERGSEREGRNVRMTERKEKERERGGSDGEHEEQLAHS